MSRLAKNYLYAFLIVAGAVVLLNIGRVSVHGNEADAQVRQVSSKSVVRETRLSDGTRCAYIFETRGTGNVPATALDCNWTSGSAR